MKRFIRKERFMLISGQKHKSTFVSPFPKRMRKYMSGLCYRLGYFHTEKLHDGILYYDSQTRRSKTSEKFAAKRYGIKFVSTEEEPHPNPKAPP